ncbi:MAG: ATP-binding protein [Alphaproteobacteria bacterium]|nr:ATP-binding protein [Alphaproteobacteria bacterium]
MAKRPLAMTISLNALEHLGINLYSNIPAVLSEIVANAWDADAHKVKVTIDKDAETITIEDDGHGMNRDEVIDRFLTVGFRRRDEIGEKTAGGRAPMGRKGIGKLSIFSIAQIAEVHTIGNGERTSFKMDREVIKKAITGKSEGSYTPDELTKSPADLKQGTRIVLSGISKSLSGMTVEGLKRRVARRFSIIGPKFKFAVEINGEAVTPEDRGYQNALEYLWTYGDGDDFAKTCKNLKRPAENRSAVISAALKAAGLKLTGWIGTVTVPHQLKDEEGDNLNRIAIFMRGKMAQEDVLDEFAQKEIYADYVIGELTCEELDIDDQGDIATSSRQALKQDDPRFEALRAVILSELRHVANRWSDWRRADGTKIALSVPAVSAWLEDLQGDTKKRAERWIGRLNTIRSADDDKKELLKASILAFESYRHRDALDRLDDMKDDNLDEVLSIFRSIDDLERSYYGQIVRGRIKVIRTLQEKLKSDEKELVLRDYIYTHLWLIDPSWERAKGTEHAETLVRKFLEADTKALKGQDAKDRIDIGYRTTSGKHVIVELKRSSVSVPVDKLVAQIRKYRDGALAALSKTAFASYPIEIICVLGKEPPEYKTSTGAAGVTKSLEAVNARIVFYDQLLTNAEQAYADYLEEHVKLDKLWNVFQAIEDFAPPEKAKAAQDIPSAAQPSKSMKIFKPKKHSKFKKK